VRASLEKEGIRAGIINARFIKPLDESMLRKLANKFNIIVTLEEGVLEGGFGSAVLEFYEKENLLGKIKVKRIGIKSEFPTFAKREELIKLYRLDGNSIFEDLVRLLKKELLWQR